MDQLGTPKASNPAPVDNNNSQQQQAGGRSHNQNCQGNNNKNGGGSNHPTIGKRKFSGLDQDELKGIVIDGSKLVQYNKLYEGLKIVSGKKNSKVRTTLINMEPLTEDDFLPTMPSPADYTVLGVRGAEVIDPGKKRLLKELWIKKGKRSAKKYDQYVVDLKSLFSTTEGQLSPKVTQHLETNESWTDVEDDQDTLSILKLLREYCYRDSATKVHPMVDVANKIYRFFSCKQDTNKSAATFAEEVKARFDVMTSAGITIRSEAMTKLALRKAFPNTSYADYTTMDESSKVKVDTLMEDMLLSVVIVNGCNTKTHRNLSGVLKDNYSLGSDVYPTSQPKALELMNQYRSVGRTATGQSNNTGGSGHNGGRGSTGGTSTTNSNDKGGGTTNETALTSNSVTTPTTGGSKVSETHQILMAGVEDGAFDGRAIFLSIQYDYCASSNPGKVQECGDTYYRSLLKDIRPHPDGSKVRIHCNVGVVIVDMVGELPGFGTVWFQEGGMANILLLSLVSNRYHITLDTAITQSFFVHKPDVTTWQFDRSPSGLYYCDLREIDGTILSDLDARQATKAQKLHDAMGFPSIKDYLNIIDNKLLLNCHDVDPILTGILTRYKAVALSIDIFTVNGIKFFRSDSRHLYFRTVRAIEDSSQSTILQTLAAIIGIYATRGLVVTVVSGDNEFNCLEEALLSRNPPG
eukprot:jgi/Psemu1/16328/gm1.16328_g